ncbi:MAG: deoxyribonuclease IV [Candidatus Marinimicrobia bacterium]|nr:deoxyribonuclease IV [Candidatus Neomarinimicrobiota bacterium]
MGLVGCHVSVSGGIEKAPQRAVDFGCEVMQVFTANQRQWTPKPITDEQATLYLKNLEKCGIQRVVAHNSYLTNLGGFEEDKLEKSLKQFEDELIRCERLKIPYLVFHPGSHLGKGEDFCLRQIAKNIDRVLENLGHIHTILLLENTAGQGTNVGYDFEHLRRIIDYSGNSEKFGVCFDTCHGFQAGYDIRTREAYEETWRKFDEILGLDLLKVFHFNDAKFDAGRNKDRHHNLGEGYIGLEPFQWIVSDERFENLPMILETPDGDEKWEEELKILKQSRL